MRVVRRRRVSRAAQCGRLGSGGSSQGHELPSKFTPQQLCVRRSAACVPARDCCLRTALPRARFSKSLVLLTPDFAVRSMQCSCAQSIRLCAVLSALLVHSSVEGCADMMSKLARRARATPRFLGVSRTISHSLTDIGYRRPPSRRFPFVCAFAPSSTRSATHKQHGPCRAMQSNVVRGCGAMILDCASVLLQVFAQPATPPSLGGTA